MLCKKLLVCHDWSVPTSPAASNASNSIANWSGKPSKLVAGDSDYISRWIHALQMMLSDKSAMLLNPFWISFWHALCDIFVVIKCSKPWKSAGIAKDSLSSSSTNSSVVAKSTPGFSEIFARGRTECWQLDKFRGPEQDFVTITDRSWTGPWTRKAGFHPRYKRTTCWLLWIGDSP